MSEMEYHTGKLILLARPEEMSLKQQLQQLIKEEEWDCKFPNNIDYLKETFFDESYGEYTLIGEDIYKIIDHHEMTESECKAWRVDNNEIIFSVSFYNGGCSFEEALEEALGELE